MTQSNREQQSNTSQVIQSNSSNCKFREAVIAPEISLFHGIRLFYPKNPESYAAFRLSGRPILCELNCYVNALFYKQHFCKQRQAEIGKKLSKS